MRSRLLVALASTLALACRSGTAPIGVPITDSDGAVDADPPAATSDASPNDSDASPPASEPDASPAGSDVDAAPTTDAPPLGDGSDGGQEAPPVATTNGCSDLFAPDVLQTYDVEITAPEWALIQNEFKNRLSVGDDPANHPYHPIVLHFGDETVKDAYIRLKGQSSWRQTIEFDGDNAKAQFVIAFDRLDDSAKFHGVSKVVFDMPRNDLTFLHERLSDTWLRQIGIFAPCANSARLLINGTYYGVYVSEEDVGHSLIKEFFPDDADGDLFKGGYTPETNKSAPNWPRLQKFWDAKDIAAVAATVDLPDSVAEWAAECLLNDADGYWGGAHNFYLYDQGAKGYVWLPEDTDATFDWLASSTTHPLFWWTGRTTSTAGQHYLIVINNPVWKVRYVDAVAATLGRFDVAQLQGSIDAWSTQIAAAVAADPHKAATVDQFHTAVLKAHNEVAERAAYMGRWISCERDRSGANATDGDGDGTPWCDDCNDGDAKVHPGATELCGNDVDDNCDGVVDEGCPGEDGGVSPDATMTDPSDGGVDSNQGD